MSIWSYKEINNSIDNNRKITLDEGDTSSDKYQIKEDNTELIVKREDKNPTGSWKDRGSAYTITRLLSENRFEAVISSSGNAAISLLTYANTVPGFKLHIVVSPNINPRKLEKIKNLLGENHKIYITDNTRKESIEISAKLKIPNLRASLDDQIIKGYWSLGFELAKLIKENNTNANTAIFVPVSSGTTLVGLVQGLFMRLENEDKMPQIYVCQTQSVHPMVNNLVSHELDNSNNANVKDSSLIVEKSLSDSIIDTVALRSPQINKIIKTTNGDSFAITNNEINNAKEWMERRGDSTLSSTSILSIAGYLKARELKKFTKVICIASGF